MAALELPFIHSLSQALRERFGGTVRKISVDAHFSCPNRDGTIGFGGCIYCDAASFSPSRRSGLATITEQLQAGIEIAQKRQKVDQFIAYFQPSTNTYGPVDYLEQVYREALAFPGIVGLAIGTRPDVLPDPVLDLLARIHQETWLSLEIGLQSANDRFLQWMNRGHDLAAFVDAVHRAKRRGLSVGVHVILGLPGETEEDRLGMADLLTQLKINSLKLHHLYVVRNTPLAEQWRQGNVPLLTCEEYARRAVDFLERIPEEVVVDRLAGYLAGELLLGPDWTASRHAARNAIEAEFRRRGTRQGRGLQNRKPGPPDGQTG